MLYAKIKKKMISVLEIINYVLQAFQYHQVF